MNYYYTPSQLNDDELQHYGVVGMRWGIRRATKKLAKADTDKKREKAVASLNKHKEKATKKIAKLEKKYVKLERVRDKTIVKNDVAAAKLRTQSTYTRAKAYRPLVSRERAANLLYKADKLKARADELSSRSNQAKARVIANETLRKTFKQGINDIDAALVEKGKRYIRG